MSYSSENPYQSPMAGEYFAAYAPAAERADFIRKTYLHLGGAVLAFAAIEAVIFLVTPIETLIQFTRMAGGYGWLIFLGLFMAVSWLARSWAESNTSQATQYLGLGLYVLAQAVLFVPLLTIAMLFSDPMVIPSAGVLTLVMFVGLSAVVFFTGSDFSYLRMFLVWGGLIALGLVLCAVFFGLSLGIWFSVAMIALASGYILYDTSNVLHHYRTDQHVAAALALFASVAILFWYMIRLLMALQSRD